MSRSYKKYPCWSAPDSGAGVHSAVHIAKRLANRKVRRPWNWDIASGNAYRRVSDSWDIRDYKSVYYYKADVIHAIETAKRDLDDRKWYRCYGVKYTLNYYYYAK